MYMSPNMPNWQYPDAPEYQCARVPDETAARARDCETIVVEADFWRHARLSWLAFAFIAYIVLY